MLPTPVDGVTSVAVLTEDPVAHIAAVLGAMKAGAIAVPLHPSNPHARLEYIVEHSGAGLVIADDASLDRSSSLGSANVMAATECAAESSEQPQVAFDPEATARIMYTSGSTGAPKGVMQSHRYLLDKTWAETAFYEFGPEDRLSQLFPLSFAASTSHTLGALLNDGTLCPYDVSTRGMHHLAAWLRDVGITGLGKVPTLFRRLLEGHEDVSAFERIRYVFLGGELVLRTDVELYRRLFPDSSLLVHRLAATETGAMTRLVIDKETVLPEAVVPAGYPAEGKQIVIVDDAGEPVPDGEVGELWVRSDNLASGYWNDRELTERTFAVDEDDPRVRTFRTGDLAMRDHGGLIVHLGRKDGRVKIRGFGVDLVEVERTLLAIDGVTEGAVIVLESGGENQLAAYFVGDSALDSTVMRRRFLEAVPDYVVPAFFVRQERLPLTPRGKIDRAALAAMEAVPESSGDYVAPDSELEWQLHSLWCDNLDVERVSAHHPGSGCFDPLGRADVEARRRADPSDRLEDAVVWPARWRWRRSLSPKTGRAHR
jgi:amino acid adenylation domain-containing protein